jgi:LAO/AO transport system kinase
VGGLAQTTAAFTEVFDAAGYDIVIVETVGAGQSEVDIARLAHTTIVVEAPGLGDEIQAIKAGILEIADVLVINKADRPGVENTERALRTTLELAHPTKRIYLHHGQTMTANITLNEAKGLSSGREDSSLTPFAQNDKPLWIPPINKTVATEGKGIAEVVDSITRHSVHIRQNGDWALRDRARLGSELEAALQETLMRQFFESISKEKYDEVIEKVIQRNLSPFEAVKLLMDGNSNQEKS